MKIALLGYGKLGKQFADALIQHKYDLIQIYNRSELDLASSHLGIPLIHNLKDLAFADVYFLAVADQHLSTISDSISNKEALQVHFSGASSLDLLLNTKRKAAAWPMFSFQAKADWNKISIALDANNAADESFLKQLFEKLGSTVYTADLEKRRKMHLAATFVNNFGNQLLRETEIYCEEQGIPFESFAGLAKATVENAFGNGPRASQTGPAKRGDLQTLDAHKALLKTEHQVKLYELFSSLIRKEHGEAF